MRICDSALSMSWPVQSGGVTALPIDRHFERAVRSSSLSPQRCSTSELPRLGQTWVEAS